MATAAPNGIGGWFAAAEENESFGFENTLAPMGHVISSPNGDRIYVLFDVFLYSDGIPPSEPSTFGVFECPVIPNAKIPLIPLSGAIDLTRIKFRGFIRGDV